MKKRFGLHLLLLLLLALTTLTTACGEVKSPTAGSIAATIQPAGNSASTSNPTKSKDKIVWWHLSTDELGKTTWQNVADAYMRANPNVTIEISAMESADFKNRLDIAIQAGTPPDLFQSWGGGGMQKYATTGVLKDLTADLKGAWGDSFSKTALEVYSMNGKNYGVPYDMGAVGFWYNKAVFQKAGINSPPQNWSEFKDAIAKLKAAGVTPIAVGAREKWPAHYFWVYLAMRIGGKAAFDKAYNRTGSFADPVYVEAGKKLQELVSLEAFGEHALEMGYQDQEKLMVSGKAGMELMGHWTVIIQKDVSANKQGLGDDLGFFPFPTVDGGIGDKNDVMGGGNGFSVSKNASPATIDFLKYLTNLENQRLLASKKLALPVVQGSESAITEPLYKVVQDSARNAKYFQLYYDQFLPPAVGEVINDNVQKIFMNTLSPLDVAQAVEKSAASEIRKK